MELINPAATTLLYEEGNYDLLTESGIEENFKKPPHKKDTIRQALGFNSYSRKYWIENG